MIIAKERRTDKRTVSTEYLFQLVRLLAEKDITAAQLARGSGVPVRVLESPDEFVSAEQYHHIIKNGLRLSRNPLLGFEHGLRLQLSSHGFLGFAMMASPTLGDAISLAIRYARTRTRLADIKYSHDGDSAIIQIQRNQAIANSFYYVVHNIVAAFLSTARFLTNNHEELTAVVKLSDTPLSDAAAYERVLGVPVFLGQTENQICFPLYLLELPVSTANIEVRRMAELECKKQLSMLKSEIDIATLILQQIEQLEAFPSLSMMADRLGTSPRTLNRKLAEVNTTYQQIINNQRHYRAIELLTETNKSVEDIAAQLGYNDPSNFTRAFRRWQGKTPRQFRTTTRHGGLHV